ncbi:MAG: flagellar basal body L-ring protein FlgH [Hyphomicrobiales bacterium]
MKKSISSKTRFVLVACAIPLAGCNTAERLAEVGRPPALSAIENPTASSGYRPVQMPMPPEVVASHTPNSLWRQGSRAFFKDQRAQQVGDILTVKVNLKDSAKIDNETQRSRSNTESLSTPRLLGFETVIPTILPGNTSVAPLLQTNSSTANQGRGTVDRSETLATTVAAVVTQLLPNGNLVIEGRQEVRVNFEVRELIVGGIVRPEDIEADNTITSTKIAEARIAYGGRGQITDVQQARYGQQVLDIILPF